jgi:hypothetical protein
MCIVDIVMAIKNRYLEDPKVEVQYHKDLADLFAIVEGT